MRDVDLEGLVASLREVREGGRTVDMPPDIEICDAICVLRSLVAGLVDAGDQVVGWKVGAIPASGGSQQFAAPVFASSLSRVGRAALTAPSIETELVATLRVADSGEVAIDPSGWRVGVEIIDNHDPSGRLTLAWAIADWGLHAAAAIGDACPAPGSQHGAELHVSGPAGSQSIPAKWTFDPRQTIDLLEQYAPRTARRCQDGDLVWTGSVCPPMPIISCGTYNLRLGSWGSVHVEVV